MASAPDLASVNGEIEPTGEITVPLRDDGLYRGDGVFEVIRLYAGRPFAMAAHLDRLERSAAAIELPVDRNTFAAEIEALLRRAEGADAQLRLLCTRGGRRIAALEPLAEWGERASLATVTYQPSVILTGVKSLSYAANMQATRIAKARGADEALLVRPDGVVLEPPTSAIFWATGQSVRTPALAAGILDSITRRAVVERLAVEEGEFELGNLLACDEAFLASTTREIQPVSGIDGTPLGEGPALAAARAAFAAALAEDLGEAPR